MTKKLTAAFVAAIALGAAAAPAANADSGTTCQRAVAAAEKFGVYEQFEDVMIHMGDEIPFVVGTACRTAP